MPDHYDLVRVKSVEVCLGKSESRVTIQEDESDLTEEMKHKREMEARCKHGAFLRWEGEFEKNAMSGSGTLMWGDGSW